MVELKIVSGGETGTVVSLTRFPFLVGRNQSDLALSAAGVWERHFTVGIGSDRSFELVPSQDAPVSVGGRLVAGPIPLRNGDLIDCGAAQLQFRVGLARQKSLAGRERAVWVLLFAALLGQFWFVLGWHP